MVKKYGENPMLFPHQKTEPGSEVKFKKEGQIFEAKITTKTPIEGCKFLLMIRHDNRTTRLWWIQGKFHLGAVDGPEVTLI